MDQHAKPPGGGGQMPPWMEGSPDPRWMGPPGAQPGGPPGGHVPQSQSQLPGQQPFDPWSNMAAMNGPRPYSPAFQAGTNKSKIPAGSGGSPKPAKKKAKKETAKQKPPKTATVAELLAKQNGANDNQTSLASIEQIIASVQLQAKMPFATSGAPSSGDAKALGVDTQQPTSTTSSLPQSPLLSPASVSTALPATNTEISSNQSKDTARPGPPPTSQSILSDLDAVLEAVANHVDPSDDEAETPAPEVAPVIEKVTPTPTATPKTVPALPPTTTSISGTAKDNQELGAPTVEGEKINEPKKETPTMTRPDDYDEDLWNRLLNNEVVPMPKCSCLGEGGRSFLHFSKINCIHLSGIHP